MKGNHDIKKPFLIIRYDYRKLDKVLLEVVKISKFYSKSFNLIFAKGMHCYNARDLINVSETYLHYES